MKAGSAPGAPLESLPSFRLAESAAWWAITKRAEDVVILDLRGRSDICDFFVMATGAVDMQVRAICDAVREGLARNGESSHHEEGLETCRWALLDFVDVVVHVFQPVTRQYYLLERLWSDAPRVEVSDDYFADPAVRERHPEIAQVPPPGAARKRRTDRK
jgi:ribosome-associated protein